MSSETDVINLAAQLVGVTPIISPGDGSITANVTDDIYTELRDQLLAGHPWNFATKRIKLAESSTTPTFEFDHAYVLPSDWLRTVSVHDNDAGHGTVLYRMEQLSDQLVLLSSSDQIWLRYIARITDPNLMTADFRRVLATSLARDMAVKLVSSNSLQQALSMQAKSILAQARSNDGMNSSPELRPRGSWANSRGGWRRSDLFVD